MSLDAKRCAELIELLQYAQRIPDSITPVSLSAIDQLRDALSLLSECRKLAYNLQNEHPALADLLDKLNEAGVE